MSAVAAVGSVTEALRTGACVARALAGDRMVREARRAVRDAASGLGAARQLVDDVELAASELATNALVHGLFEPVLEGGVPVAGLPELWLYVRGTALPRELVVCVFSPGPAWAALAAPAVGMPDEGGESGRGLQIIAGLGESWEGRWGWRLSRARLGCVRGPGTASWVALPLPEDVQAGPPFDVVVVAEAVDRLAALLRSRGLDGMTCRVSGSAGMLALGHGLTVWVLRDVYRWGDGAGVHVRSVLDVVDVAEQVLDGYERRRRGVEVW